jgi:hypothetical protein
VTRKKPRTDPRLEEVARLIAAQVDLRATVEDEIESAALRVLENLDEPLPFEEVPSDVVRAMGPTHPFLTCVCELCVFRRDAVARLEELEHDARRMRQFS